MIDLAKTLLTTTREQLDFGKKLLAQVEPALFMGAGLQFVSLAARQVLLESICVQDDVQGDNELGWSIDRLENTAWLMKHQREVAVFYQYCQCVEGYRQRGAPWDVIVRSCNCKNPEVQLGPSWLISEGMRKILQWLNQ